MNKILEHYLFDAFSNASDNLFVYVTDIKNDISRWSPKAVEYFNLESEYLSNMKELWVQHVHPEDREIYIKDISAVFEGRSSQHNCQYRALNRYGEYVWVECRGSMIRDDDGEMTVFAGIMTRLDNQLKYDNLTHLKTAYELQHQIFDTAEGALMLIGVDGFRNVNSQHGLIFGNKVLVYLAELLQREAPRGAIAYRFQGDEFVLYARGCKASALEEVFHRMRMVCMGLSTTEEITSFSISAGIVSFPEDGKNFAEVISKAEMCLAHAKEFSASHLGVFSKEIEAKQVRKNRIAEELIDSIKNDFKGFELYYQPIVSNEGKTVVGCEALLRWKPASEEIGNCYPGEFIPILEENGTIVPVGYYVMREAIRQAAQWQKHYKKFSVSFNVSYLQMEDPWFVPSLIDTAKEFGVDTTKITVELTESVFAADTILVQKSFEALRSEGFKIALDDFGTGNSSFWMLHNLNVDIIKLDQAFIRGLNRSGSETDYAIVESVAYLCERIHYQTVAEGVEDENLWKKIKEFGFIGLQGYLFSRPVPVSQFEELLERYQMKAEN